MTDEKRAQQARKKKTQKLLVDLNPIEGEYIPPETTENMKLNLRRTKQYTKQIMGMDGDEALKMLTDQVTTKLLLLGEAILKQLEALDEIQPDDWRNRAAIAGTIETLTKCATNITSNKATLDKALGAHLLPMIPATAPTIGEEEGEITADEFMSEYKKRAMVPGAIPMPLAKS
jgi:hypothetical protein